jgi:hypothetical protein
MCNNIVMIDDHLDFIPKCRDPLSRLEDFKPEELRKLSRKIFKKIRSGVDMYEAYLSVLIENGVMCPHPSQFRVYKDSTVAYGLERREYTCSLCKSESFEGEVSFHKNREVQDLEA